MRIKSTGQNPYSKILRKKRESVRKSLGQNEDQAEYDQADSEFSRAKRLMNNRRRQNDIDSNEDSADILHSRDSETKGFEKVKKLKESIKKRKKRS